MTWDQSPDLLIWVFNVGRGNAAFMRTPMNQGIILDMASSEDFSPTQHLRNKIIGKLNPYKNKRIAQAILSHPHTDHIVECSQLEDELHPELITCPHDKVTAEAVNWSRIKNIDGTRSLAPYRRLFESRTPPLQTIEYTSGLRPALEFAYGIYYVRPPVCDKIHSNDNDYGNATSIVTYAKYGNNSILFPGDITPEAMKKVLDQSEGVEKRFTVFSREETRKNSDWHRVTGTQPSLKWLLSQFGLSVLVAPHHGLESCYSPELYGAIRGGKPQVVVISEKRKTSDNHGSTHKNYQCSEGSSGLYVNFPGRRDLCNSVTTKSGHILIRMNGNGVPRIGASQDINGLLPLVGL